MGLLFLNSQIRSREILNGRSQTLLPGEKAESYNQNWASGTGEMLRNNSGPGVRSTFFPNHNLFAGGFSSHHPTGANLCLADGSIRLIFFSVDPLLFQQIGHRADGGMMTLW
jgi:hypothetical protein